MFLKLFIITIVLILVLCACGQLIYTLTHRKKQQEGEQSMADSVAQVYMIGVMCIMAFFAVSCLIGVGKAKKRKDLENTKQNFEKGW